MNRRQRSAVFALYRTLLRRRWHRLGPTMKSLGALLVTISAVVAGGAFLLAFLLGFFLLPNASGVGVLLAWDGVLLAFLFFRVWGMVTDLRVADVLSMQNLLHLPLTPSDVFLLNVIALHLQPSPLIFGAAFLGLALASIFALGPGHAILLPLALAAFWCVIALTRQLQTFLASLMVNKRRRGTIVAVCVMVPMLLIQLPNIFMQVQLWDSLDRSDTEPRQLVEVELSDSGAPSQGLLVTNLALPPAWLAVGAYQAKRDRFWPAAAGTLGLLAVVGWSLRRSYRSALRVYRRSERQRVARRGEQASSPRTRRHGIAEGYWSFFPPIAATVGRASLRQWVRSPHGKQALVTSILVLLLAALAALRLEEVSKSQPYVGLGLAALCSFGPIVFATNLFGWDRGGFRVLLATGPPRRLVLLGKNIGLVPMTLGPGIAVLVATQLLWPQPATHFLASGLQVLVFCLVLFMIGNHFSITAPWAVSFMSLKQRGEAVASNLGAFLVAAFSVGAVMLGIAGLLALERLVADAGWPAPLYLIFSVLELGLAALWYRDALRYQAKALLAQEERILEVINTPVD